MNKVKKLHITRSFSESFPEAYNIPFKPTFFVSYLLHNKQNRKTLAAEPVQRTKGMRCAVLTESGGGGG